MPQVLGAVALLSFKQIAIDSQKVKKMLISKVKLGFQIVEFQNSTKNQKYTHVNFTGTFYSSC